MYANYMSVFMTGAESKNKKYKKKSFLSAIQFASELLPSSWVSIHKLRQYDFRQEFKKKINEL